MHRCSPYATLMRYTLLSHENASPASATAVKRRCVLDEHLFVETLSFHVVVTASPPPSWTRAPSPSCCLNFKNNDTAACLKLHMINPRPPAQERCRVTSRCRQCSKVRSPQRTLVIIFSMLCGRWHYGLKHETALLPMTSWL